jgi:hypothetical protein
VPFGSLLITVICESLFGFNENNEFSSDRILDNGNSKGQKEDTFLG